MRTRIYRGWTALFLAALAMVGTLPGRTQGLGLVTAPLLRDLHLGDSDFARANFVATIIGAGFALPAGWLIDRVGVRVAVPLFELGLGLVVLAMARAHEIAGLTLLLVLTRGFGQTALSVGSLATIGKWFARRLEKAMGIYALVLGMGFIAAFRACRRPPSSMAGAARGPASAGPWSRSRSRRSPSSEVARQRASRRCSSRPSRTKHRARSRSGRRCARRRSGSMA
jgi:MFS family permease